VSTGCTGGAPIFTVAVTAGLTDGPRAEMGLSERTRLEMAAGRRAAERRAAQAAIPSAKKSSVIANATPFSLGEPVNTGLLEAAANQPTDLAKDIQHEVPVLDFPPVQERVNAETAALTFLDDFFGADMRHLVAIKKGQGKNEIKAHHFDAADRVATRSKSGVTSARLPEEQDASNPCGQRPKTVPR
jgi:hypothetical protein